MEVTGFPHSGGFSKIKIAAVVAMAVLSFTTLYFQNFNSGRFQLLKTTHEGLSTCFFRVGQTYMARMLGDQSSTYLEKNFIDNTENCFADVSQATRSESLFRAASSVLVNQMQGEVHAFHEGLQATNSVFSRASSEKNNLNDRYIKLESLKFEIEDMLEASSAKVMRAQKYWFWGGLTAIALLIFFTSYLIFFQKNTHVKNSIPQSLQARRIDVDDQSEILAMVSEHDQADANEHKVSIDFVKQEQLQPEVELFSVEETLSKALELISNKLFSYGVTVDLDVAVDLTIPERKLESLEQIFYNSLVLGLGNSADHAPRSMRISLKESVEELSFSSIVEFRSARDNFDRKSMTVTVLQEMIKENNGLFELKNLTNADGKIVGIKISAYLPVSSLIMDKAESVTEGKRITVRKGKKRELLSSIQAQLE